PYTLSLAEDSAIALDAFQAAQYREVTDAVEGVEESENGCIRGVYQVELLAPKVRARPELSFETPKLLVEHRGLLIERRAIGRGIEREDVGGHGRRELDPRA